MFTAPVAELAQALASKRLSSVELTTALFDRIDAIDPHLNAFLARDRKRALGAAKAADARLAAGDATPLTGIPIAHKDVLMTAGWRTTCGSRTSGRARPTYSEACA